MYDTSIVLLSQATRSLTLRRYRLLIHSLKKGTPLLATATSLACNGKPKEVEISLEFSGKGWTFNEAIKETADALTQVSRTSMVPSDISKLSICYFHTSEYLSFE